jgi:ADP-ribosylglycohydrolase
MRASPIGWYCSSIDDVLSEAKRSAEVTHNHPEGIKGAQAAALAVFLARTGESKEVIKKTIQERFEYDLDRTIDKIRPVYEFNESCQGTVPEAIIAFLESTDFENAIRLAVSIGGDSDTVAAITGGIAEAFYREIPEYIVDFVKVLLGPDLMQETIIPFSGRWGY